MFVMCLGWLTATIAAQRPQSQQAHAPDDAIAVVFLPIIGGRNRNGTRVDNTGIDQIISIIGAAIFQSQLHAVVASRQSARPLGIPRWRTIAG